MKIYLHRLGRILRRLIPFKGNHSWEMQIGPLVLMMRREKHWSYFPSPRFKAYLDPDWIRLGGA